MSVRKCLANPTPGRWREVCRLKKGHDGPHRYDLDMQGLPGPRWILAGPSAEDVTTPGDKEVTPRE